MVHVLLSLEWDSQWLSNHVGFEISLGNMGEFWCQQDLVQKQPEQVSSPLPAQTPPLWTAWAVCEQPEPETAAASDLSHPLVHTPAPCRGFGTVPLLPGSRWRKSTFGLAEGFLQKKAQTELSFKHHHHNAGLTEASRLSIEHFENGDQVKSAQGRVGFCRHLWFKSCFTWSQAAKFRSQSTSILWDFRF